MRDKTAQYRGRVPWGDVLLSSIAAVSWALIGMAGTAALGLHLLGADAAGSLGPMTAAVVALGAGGSVTPSGDVSAFGLKGAEAHTAVQITPLGVGLVGALLLAWFFLRSLRGVSGVLAPRELLARAGTVVALFVAVLGALTRAGHDVITVDGARLGLDRVPGGGGLGGITDKLPGGLGDIGGLLPDGLDGLADTEAAVTFTVDTAATLLGGAVWCTGVLLVALLASRRTPLPRGWDAVHRVVRPASSALVTVVLVAVLAGLAAAAYAAVGDDHPKRIAGAALLGAPNGVWLGLPVGLFVPWDGKATGELVSVLPDPLDKLLSTGSDRPVTLGRLAGLDGRVWLLGVAAALMMLTAGVLTAARTPYGGGRGAAPAGGEDTTAVRGGGAAGFAGRCALRLGVATALALPLLARLTDVSVDASVSVLGFDAFGAGVELHGHLWAASLLGAVWGAGAGTAGALLAHASGAAGRRAAPLARRAKVVPDAVPGGPGLPGPYEPGAPYRPPNPATNPYLRLPDELRDGVRDEVPYRQPGRGRDSGRGREHGRGRGRDGDGAPDRDHGRGDARGREPGQEERRGPGRAGREVPEPDGRPADDVYGAPTVAGPWTPPPRSPARRPHPGPPDRPPPPPPPPPSPSAVPPTPPPAPRPASPPPSPPSAEGGRPPARRRPRGKD
ncbi:streptophobe family protein [Streptomyces sp. NPDC008313]|uniref:streptophobe family protein n=1 Tax=Streptomyces sp. NPDC008313 TaxID=3364826 RepID=UPI0036E564EF